MPWSDCHVNLNDTALWDPYWLQFEPPPYSILRVFGILIAVITAISVIGNAAVLYVILRSPTLRKQKLYVANLALSDFISPAATYHFFVTSSFNGIWTYGKTVCEIYGFLQGYFGLMSIVSLAAIALERYYATAKPSSAFANLPYAKKLSVIFFIWMYCFIVSLPPLIGISRFVPAGYLVSCCLDFITRDLQTRLYIVVLFVFGLATPMLFIVFSYVRIWQLSSVSKPESTDETQRIIKEKNLRFAKVIMLLVIVFLVAWGPYAAIVLLGQFGPYGADVTPIMVMIPLVIARSSTLYNPFIFAFYDSQFQRAMRRYVFCCCCPPPEGEGSETVAAPVPTVNNAESVPLSGLAGIPEIPGMEISDEQDLEDDDDYLDAQLSYRLIEVERSPRDPY